jgi:primosomal protein N' (replication factor Y)
MGELGDMESAENFREVWVDVVLPLALPGLLTYAIPPEIEAASLKPGVRVVVPLRGRRLYTAVVRQIRLDCPDYKVVPIETVLDDKPVVPAVALKFWDWISAYYMCGMGEVALAALPAGLRLGSETRVELVDANRADEELQSSAFDVVEALRIRGSMTLVELGKALNVAHPAATVQRLIDTGWVVSSEEMKKVAGPRKVTMVRWSQRSASDERWLSEQVETTGRRAPAQHALLLHMADKMDAMLEGRAVQPMLGAVEGATEQQVRGALARLVTRGVVVKFERDPLAAPARGGVHPLAELSPAQQKSLEQVQQGFADNKNVLLEGVTGSGKTEVYTHAIDRVLRKGQDVLFLVPEIALTAQLIIRLRKFFGSHLEVYHSRFSRRERTATHRRISSPSHDGAGRLVVGARSAIFLPFDNLGLVVVDEEHDPSYKQQDPAPRYQARDAVIKLAQFHGARVLLGSATPSLELRRLAQLGQIGHVRLSERFGGAVLPEVRIVDLRMHYKRRTMEGHFSLELIDAIAATLAEGRQVILFQNRRGYAPTIQCHLCGWTPECERCDVGLTYHKRLADLHCHYCGYRKSVPPACPRCKSEELISKGLGTERIVEEMAARFPEHGVERMDLDTTRSPRAHEQIIARFESAETAILVGTQMVTKGLDFDGVGLVGVLQADRLLHFPDFRAFERTFQLLTQVAGRAGRRKKQGLVLVQTFDPEHWVLQHVIDHDAETMAAAELHERHAYGYPPHTRLFRLSLRHRDPYLLRQAAASFADRLRGRYGDRVVGPEEPSVPRVNDTYIRNILIKLERESSAPTFKIALKEDIAALAAVSEWKKIRVVIDVDPY